MRIAQVANFYGPSSGGLRTALHALGHGYVGHGDEVLLVVPGDHDADEDTPHGRRITLHSPVLPGTGGYRAITRLGAVHDALTEFAPDALEVSDRTTLASLGPWATRRGINATFIAHERVDRVVGVAMPAALEGAVPGLAARHVRWLTQRFPSIVATTAFAGEEFARAGHPVTTVPLGVDLDRFHPGHHSPLVRRRHAEDGEVLMLLASRLSPEKNPHIAIDAARELARRGRPVRLVCAGAGPLDGSLRRRAAGAPVEFLGFVNDRARFAALLATADLILAPGPHETFGLSALEALASGTPAVVSATSALPEVVGDAGVAAANTATAFADAVDALLSRDGRGRRAAARARAEQFPWEATVSRMRAVHGTPVAA
ncbi:glycosyltransferase [Demequina pelophila]|uniref:glycosyltransferase n=1 Tax=Demequina pelophila TaxID=1638984 RepID=UPI0007815107|nr:glycosyltransferase [Demequina pelophila]